MEATRHTVTIEGLNVTYYRYGHGVPLLFLHGRRVRAVTFRRSLEELSKHYMVVAPDIPGYGASTTPPDAWSYTDYAAFFDSFLKKLELHDVTVVGYSMGGGIAFNLAAVSRRISRLVLVDASGLHIANIKPHSRDLERFFFYLFHPRYISALLVLLRDYTQYLWKHRQDAAQMQRIRRACYEASYEDALRHITTPTLLLWGENDKDIPIAVAYDFLNHIPQAVLKTVKENHDWPLYNPILFSQSVL